MRFKMHKSIALLCLLVEQKNQSISSRTLNFLCGALNMANKLTTQTKINNKSQNLSLPSLLSSISIFRFSLHFYFAIFIFYFSYLYFPFFTHHPSAFSFLSLFLSHLFFSFPLIPNFSPHEIFFSHQFFSTPDFLSLSLSLYFIH